MHIHEAWRQVSTLNVDASRIGRDFDRRARADLRDTLADDHHRGIGDFATRIHIDDRAAVNAIAG